VHLSYVREGTGHALVGAREWIPAEQISDPARSQDMGLPPDLAFCTKGQLAADILAEVFADGVRLDFVCGDEVYGSCTGLREFLEDRAQPYVLRVPSSFRLMLPGGVSSPVSKPRARLPGVLVAVATGVTVVLLTVALTTEAVFPSGLPGSVAVPSRSGLPVRVIRSKRGCMPMCACGRGWPLLLLSPLLSTSRRCPSLYCGHSGA
jgi:hypothetical protein